MDVERGSVDGWGETRQLVTSRVQLRLTSSRASPSGKRVCAKDANGVDYCALESEVTDGTITAAPPPGAPDTASSQGAPLQGVIDVATGYIADKYDATCANTTGGLVC